MISLTDFYHVMTAVVPLYVAMILAYGSVKWWKIFTPDQCSGINRFVALFAVPLLSFHFISLNDPYKMNLRFIAADTLQKIIILALLAVWSRLSARGSLEWSITLFSLSTLPNTLVMGIPLLKGMYGDESGTLMVQIVVLQCIIWYTLMLFLFEYRGARLLIGEQFPETAASIISFKVDSDILSLDGKETLETQAEVGEDGKLHVTVRKSTSSRSEIYSRNNKSTTGQHSGLSLTPRPSNLTNVEIYSLQSSRNATPRGSSFNHTDFYSLANGKSALSPRHSNYGMSYDEEKGGVVGKKKGDGGKDLHILSLDGKETLETQAEVGEDGKLHVTVRKSTSSRSEIYSRNNKSTTGQHSGLSLTPRPSNLTNVEIYSLQSSRNATPRGSSFNHTDFYSLANGKSALSPRHSNYGMSYDEEKGGVVGKKKGDGGKDLHMFVWSSSASPVSEGGIHVFRGGADYGNDIAAVGAQPKDYDGFGRNEFSFGNRQNGNEGEPTLSKLGSGSTTELHPKSGPVGEPKPSTMPPASVVTRLILIMVWRKLIRNPNTYSSLIGLTWALVSFRWGIHMPAIIFKSISILSDTGLGMAMFSLGFFMALQPKMIACGNTVATFSMAVRFITGPAVMAVASILVGLRGTLLHIAIVQAALPQGIVPFVFAKEYNVHPKILSTGVIFGMLIALPITLVYYILLGL